MQYRQYYWRWYRYRQRYYRGRSCNWRWWRGWRCWSRYGYRWRWYDDEHIEIDIIGRDIVLVEVVILIMV